MARGKGGLGRGLDSLFEDAAPVFESGAKVDTLPLREIEPDPEQPRKTFDEQALGELAASIAEHGLLQPIAVRPRPRGGYSIVAGERRWRACRMAGLNDVPVVIKEVSDEQAMELALVENLQREDLDPVEEATGIRELMTRCGLTQEQAAQKLGKSRSALANSRGAVQKAGKARKGAQRTQAAGHSAGGGGRKSQAGAGQRGERGLPRRQGQADRAFLFRRAAAGLCQPAGTVPERRIKRSKAGDRL